MKRTIVSWLLCLAMLAAGSVAAAEQPKDMQALLKAMREKFPNRYTLFPEEGINKRPTDDQIQYDDALASVFEATLRVRRCPFERITMYEPSFSFYRMEAPTILYVPVGEPVWVVFLMSHDPYGEMTAIHGAVNADTGIVKSLYFSGYDATPTGPIGDRGDPDGNAAVAAVIVEWTADADAQKAWDKQIPANRPGDLREADSSRDEALAIAIEAVLRYAEQDVGYIGTYEPAVVFYQEGADRFRTNQRYWEVVFRKDGLETGDPEQYVVSVWPTGGGVRSLEVFDHAPEL